MRAYFGLLVLSIGATVLVPSRGDAHARLVSPQPRSNDSGLKTGPCGGLAKSTNTRALAAGQIVTVSWEETINHPGKFLIKLLGPSDVFQMDLATVIDGQNNQTLPHAFQAQVTIPNLNCGNCAIQLIQSMEENPSAPTYYYSCADVVISGATQTPTPTASSSPTPGNTPQPTPTSSPEVNALGSQPDGKNVVVGNSCGSVRDGGQTGLSKMEGSRSLAVVFLLPLMTFLIFRFKLISGGSLIMEKKFRTLE